MPKILVVDDQPDNVTLLTMDLEDHGYESISAYSGKEALLLVEEKPLDAILLDVMMPEMDGFEVCRRLKSNPKWNHIPVIMVTAKDTDADVVAGLDVGADDYLSKPVNFRILLARLEAALRVKNAHDAIQLANTQLQTANDLLDVKSKRLAELNKVAYEFVDDVSHDLRTPLSVIKEFACIMREGLAGVTTAEQQEYLGIIANSVDDLGRMVVDMLDTSKVEAGLLRVRRTICDCREILERVQPLLQRRAMADKVHFDVELDANLPKVYCDSVAIGRVITNLAANAIKFVQEDGHVKLWARYQPDSDEVVVGVTDDGPGIEPSRLEMIFERFQQLPGNVRARTKGVGLGLNISKELVSMNFGQMNVESTLGNGSTFSFTIPSDDMMKLIARHLKVPSTERGLPAERALVAAGVTTECEDSMIEAVDEFLHDILRGSDLVLRIQPNRWLIVADTGQNGGVTVVQRVHENWEEFGQRFGCDMLPDLAVNLVGTWSVPTQQDEFLSSFQMALDSMQPIEV